MYFVVGPDSLFPLVRNSSFVVIINSPSNLVPFAGAVGGLPVRQGPGLPGAVEDILPLLCFLGAWYIDVKMKMKSY